MADGNPAVDEFIETKVLPEYRAIVTAYRELIRKEFPEIKEEMRAGTEAYYGTPAYRVQRIVSVISPNKKGITFAFSKGANFKDKYHMLEGVGNAAKNVRIAKLEDFNEEAMKYYLRQAVDMDKE